MKNCLSAIASAVLIVGVAVGCSSDPAPQKLKRGTLPPGVASVSIDDDASVQTGSVQCAAVGPLTTIRTGDDKSGLAAELSSAHGFAVNFVRLRDLEGFSGDYNAGLGGDAAVSLTDTTFHINGTAFGYTPKSIAPARHSFTIEVAC